MAADPIARFRRWFEEARRARIPQHEAAALATSDRRGRPSVRFVLVKQFDRRGFVFFTNLRSRKGRELLDNPYAALAIYWDQTGKQVRIEGKVREVSPSEADAYWASRPRAHNVAALASNQSAPLHSRRELLARFRKLHRFYEGLHLPRPRGWTGFRIVPDAIEFWTRREDRLHHRELFARRGRAWRRTLLHP